MITMFLGFSVTLKVRFFFPFRDAKNESLDRVSRVSPLLTFSSDKLTFDKGASVGFILALLSLGSVNGEK